MLALLELDLGGRADLDDGDAAGQLGETLLELLTVVVGVGVLDLATDLGDATSDLVGIAGAVDDRALVLRHADGTGAAEQLEGDGVELETDLLGDDLATGEDRDVREHRLAAITEAGGLDGDRLERALDLVDEQAGESLSVDVLRDHQERLAALDDLLQHWQQIAQRGDLGVDDEDVRVVEDGLHTLGVGDEVRRDVALVEAHALGELKLEPEGVRLLDGDDAFLADLVHRLGDDLADRGVSGGDRRGGRDLLAGLDVGSHRRELGHDCSDSLLDAALERHRVGAGGDVAQTFAHHRLGEHGGRRRAVAGDVVGLLGDLLDELGADLLEGILELDLLGDGDAVVGDRGRAPLLLKDDVAALRAQGHLDGVGEDVHTSLKTAASLDVEFNELCHVFRVSSGCVGVCPQLDVGRACQCPRRTVKDLTD